MNLIIDISEHNGNIDFKKVKNSGIEGVIIRVGWIGNKQNHTIDKKFEEYYRGAKANNLKIGFYVYSYCFNENTLLEGTVWVYNRIKDKSFNLPIFLDLEDGTISTLSKENLTRQAILFCNYFKNKGYKSGVYASKYWFLNKLDINKLLNFKIWLAEWNGKENHTLGYKVDLWQYTSRGIVSGINTNVDMNKCLCDCVETVDNNVEKGEFEMKVYKNGSTIEPVYQDINCTKNIGYLNKYEQCECYGIINNKALVVYNIDGTSNKKTGFVKWLGGVR